MLLIYPLQHHLSADTSTTQMGVLIYVCVRAYNTNKHNFNVTRKSSSDTGRLLLGTQDKLSILYPVTNAVSMANS